MSGLYAYSSRDWTPEEQERDFHLFFGNIDVVMENAAAVFACSEYFFCPLSFASGSLGYIGGPGALTVGHLLWCWGEGALRARCPECSGDVLVSTFGGSPLSGRNQWIGYCTACGERQIDSWPGKFGDHFVPALKVTSQYPAEVPEWVEYDGFEFSWGGDGLKPARKRRQVRTRVAELVDLDTLIDELRRGDIRPGAPPIENTDPKKFGFRIVKADGTEIHF